MIEPYDHEVKIRLTGSQYIAARHLAEHEERSLSGWVRWLIARELSQVSAAMAERDRSAPGQDQD